MLSSNTKAGIADYLTNPGRFRTASPWFDDRLLLLESHVAACLYVVKLASYKKLISESNTVEVRRWIQIMLPATMLSRIVYVSEEHFAAASTCKALGGEQATYEYLYSVKAIT